MYGNKIFLLNARMCPAKPIDLAQDTNIVLGRGKGFAAHSDRLEGLRPLKMIGQMVPD